MSKLALAKDMKKMDGLAMEKFQLTEADLVAKAADAFINAVRGDEIMHGVKSILVICGNGQNGDDGVQIAKILSPEYEVTVYRILCGLAEPDPSDFDLIIDAVFGTGFKGAFDRETSAYMKLVNSAQVRRVSVDIPSGAECDSAEICNNCFRADLTVTFEFLKPACVSYPSVDYCGRVVCVPIGFDDQIRAVVEGNPDAPEYVDSIRVKKRRRDSNKGDYGTLLEVCGSDFMLGAAYFAAMGALRSGVGLLTLAVERSMLHVLQTKLHEPVFLPIERLLERLSHNKFNAVLFGCGCGKTLQTTELLKQFLFHYCKRSLTSSIPLILDADGINLLSENIYLLTSVRNCVLTPHPAEFARLTSRTVRQVQSERIAAARDFSAQFGCVVVLKGARSVIAAPDGRFAINATGNPGMAKGGSGDILAGMIASLCAQGFDAYDAAVTAVYIHGAAGDLCAEQLSETGMLPSDMLDRIPLFFQT